MRTAWTRVLAVLALAGAALVTIGCSRDTGGLEKRNRQALEREFPGVEWVVSCSDIGPMDQPMQCDAGFVADDQMVADIEKLYAMGGSANAFAHRGGLDGVGGIGAYRKVDGKLFQLRVECPGKSPQFAADLAIGELRIPRNELLRRFRANRCGIHEVLLDP